MPGTVEDLLAERAIRDVLHRYCRGVDRMDRELVRSCYHPDALDSHGSFTGTVEQYLDWLWRLLGRYRMTMHLLGNVLVEFHPDTAGLARVETYGTAHHRSDDPRPHLNLVTGFCFVDRFERRDGAWRVARRLAVTEWSRHDDPDHWWPVPPHLPAGRRDRTDPVYAGWDELGTVTTG